MKFFSQPIEQIDSELKEAQRVASEGEEADKSLSSHVWICTSTHATSKVTVIDANSPADVLESFQVCASHLLCITSVPGAKPSDYKVDEELNRLVHRGDDGDEVKPDAGGLLGNDGDDEDEAGSYFTHSWFTLCTDGIFLLIKLFPESRPKLTRETAIEPGKKKNWLHYYY